MKSMKIIIIIIIMIMIIIVIKLTAFHAIKDINSTLSGNQTIREFNYF